MKSKLNLDQKVVDSARQHAANIAHDIRTPVTVISGYAKAILDGMMPEQEQRRYVESLSAYARMFLDNVDKPDVDNPIYVEGAQGLQVGDFVNLRISQGFSNGMVAELEK